MATYGPPYGIGQTIIFWKGQEGKNSS